MRCLGRIQTFFSKKILWGNNLVFINNCSHRTIENINSNLEEALTSDE